jgi:hypothetical protein
MEGSRSAVNPFLSESGSNRKTFNTNKKDDVNPLVGEEKDLDIVTKKTPTKLIETKFDITDFLGVGVTWSWFTNKKLKIVYVGSNDSIDLFITNAEFQVAVKRRVRVYSDDVTCKPESDENNKPSEVIRRILLKGGLGSNFIDSVSFAAADQRYSVNNYRFNGVIPANTTVREATRSATRQCRSRLIWSAGKAKLKFRDFFTDWVVDKYLAPEDLQLKSIAASRQKISELENIITLFFNKDWVDGHYKTASIKKDQISIERNGSLEKRGNWEFDLVTSDGMAEDLAEFYLSLLSTPSTFYNFNSYLSQFEIEKEDKLGITSSGFNQMVKLPVVIRATNRIFGSGEAGQINLINIIAESFRYIKRSISLGDEVSINDAINILIGLSLNLADGVNSSDEIKLAFGKIIEEYVAATDLFSIIQEYNLVIDETTTTSDSISFHLQLLFQENVTTSDVIAFSRNYGYGSGGYGVESGYGGVLDFGFTATDLTNVIDDISFNFATVLTDTVSSSDTIAFSDGYGSPVIGDGYGLVPYGR